MDHKQLATYYKFKGRISRKTFWLSTLILGGVSALVMLLLFLLFLLIGEEKVMFLLIILIPFGILKGYADLALMAKRLHDQGKTAWWMGWLFLPQSSFIAGMILFVECGFLVGTPGENEHGEDPLKRSADDSYDHPKQSVVWLKLILIGLSIFLFPYFNKEESDMKDLMPVVGDSPSVEIEEIKKP